MKNGNAQGYKYMFLFATVFGCSFIVFFINNSVLFVDYNQLFQHSYLREELAVQHEDTNVQTFAVNTEGCKIPKMQPYNKDIEEYVKPENKTIDCLRADKLPLLANNDTHIWVDDEFSLPLNVSDKQNFSCCYLAFYRPNEVRDIRSGADNRVKYDECVPFQNIVPVKDEFVRVVCKYNEDKVHDEFFVFAPQKEFRGNENSQPLLANDSMYNVIVLGIDAVSRMNFHRTMPKTLKFLQERQAVELKGYNKVGDNTFPNLVPVLLGTSANEIKYMCHPRKNVYFDGCPFVWEWYKQAGYYTAFAEDSAFLATFDYAQPGFSGFPTDYYTYTFMVETAKHVAHNHHLNSNLCMGAKFYYQVLLDYVSSLLNTLRSYKLFGFFWEVTFSHDYLNYPRYMDESYYQFFSKLELNGVLNNSIIVLMSDHGIRWGGIRNTKQGRLEERLPFMYFLMPESFRSTYDYAYSNLRSNARRLTTPYDMHETLLDLVDLANITNDKIANRSMEWYSNNRGISWFLPVPANRTCRVAGIDDHWCTCHRSKSIAVEDKLTVLAVKHLMHHINGLLKGHKLCEKLELAEVLSAEELLLHESLLQEVEVSWRDFTVVVRTRPGGALFEATLQRRHDGSWAVTGTISRLNLYGKQSHCVNDYQLKLYCFCR